MRRRSLALVLVMGSMGWWGCTAQEDSGSETMDQGADAVELGPVDGRDLPAVDLDRIQVGDMAPDFTLASLDGPLVTLSQFQGERNVVLVFYRGHW